MCAVGPLPGTLTTRLPSPLNAALDRESVALGSLDMGPIGTTISLSLSAFQIRAVWSEDAVTTCLPSLLNVAVDTGPVWPFRTAISLPLSASQTRAVLSL